MSDETNRSCFAKHVIFRNDYIRNFRPGGKKNLRCFPYCSPEHRPNNFCGGKVQVNYYKKDNIDEGGTITAFAELAMQKDAFKFTRGQRFQGQEILANLRTPEHKRNHWISCYEDKKMSARKRKSTAVPLADTTNVDQQAQTADGPNDYLEFTLNPNDLPWHYGWEAQKFIKVTIFHELRIYFVKLSNDQEQMECIDILQSPPFQVFSPKTKSSKTYLSKLSSPLAQTDDENSVDAIATAVQTITNDGDTSLSHDIIMKDDEGCANGVMNKQEQQEEEKKRKLSESAEGHSAQMSEHQIESGYLSGIRQDHWRTNKRHDANKNSDMSIISKTGNEFSKFQDRQENLHPECMNVCRIVTCSLCCYEENSIIARSFITKCFHIFCENCIRGILKTESSECPSCKKKLFLEDFKL